MPYFASKGSVRARRGPAPSGPATATLPSLLAASSTCSHSTSQAGFTAAVGGPAPASLSRQRRRPPGPVDPPVGPRKEAIASSLPPPLVARPARALGYTPSIIRALGPTPPQSTNPFNPPPPPPPLSPPPPRSLPPPPKKRGGRGPAPPYIRRSPSAPRPSGPAPAA